MTDDAAHAEVRVRSAEVSAVFIRRCARCSAPRQPERTCAQCGNPDPPEMTDLGIISASYRSPLRRAWRAVAGDPLARRSLRRASRRTDALKPD